MQVFKQTAPGAGGQDVTEAIKATFKDMSATCQAKAKDTAASDQDICDKSATDWGIRDKNRDHTVSEK